MIKCLSIKQPWAWAICNLPDRLKKDYENRTWNTKFRGEFLVHASKGFDKIGYVRFLNNLKWLGYEGHIPTKEEFIYGAIIGKTELVDVVKPTEESDSVWYEFQYGFKLQNTVALDKPIPYKGQLNFFNVDEEILPKGNQA